MTLTNGNVSGDCGGTFNNTCSYVGCNEGFYLSSNGSATRTCNQSGFYSGTPMTCLRKLIKLDLLRITFALFVVQLYGFLFSLLHNLISQSCDLSTGHAQQWRCEWELHRKLQQHLHLLQLQCWVLSLVKHRPLAHVQPEWHLLGRCRDLHPYVICFSRR